jgi:LPS sulfotransferase NodH
MFGAFKTEMDLPKAEVTFTYLILSQPRTGSTMITSALQSSGLAGVPVEYFNHQHLVTLPKPLTMVAVQKYYQDVVSRRTSANGVFGMKIHEEQFRSLFVQENTVKRAGVKFLKSFDRIILVSRRDKVAQAMSQLTAHRAQHWNSRDKEQRGKQNYEFDRNDVPILLSYIRKAVEGEIFWDAVCAQLNLTPLRITYERLSQSPQVELSKILAHLGLPAIEISPQTVKLSRDSNSDAKQRFLKEMGVEWNSAS